MGIRSNRLAIGIENAVKSISSPNRLADLADRDLRAPSGAGFVVNPCTKPTRLWTDGFLRNKLSESGALQFAISSQFRQSYSTKIGRFASGSGSASTLIAIFARSYSSFIRLGRCTQLAIAHWLRRLLWNPFWTGILAMSDKKDFSKQRLSDFLAARLRAKGHDESQAQKSRP